MRQRTVTLTLLSITTVLSITLAGCASLPLPRLPSRTASSTTSKSMPVRPTATPDAGPLPRFERVDAGDCFVLLEDDDAECGYVIVPEDRATITNTATIRLAVIRFRSTGPHPQPDPFVYASGGPGGHAIEFADSFMRSGWFELVRPQRDIVLFDQRGAGASVPHLTCEPRSDEQKDMPDRDYSKMTDDEATTTYWHDCAELQRLRGIHLAAYNSLQNAADVNDIHSALGYDTINLYGVSYGSQLAQHVMRDFPMILRSVVLDGVVPLPRDWVARKGPALQHALDAVLAACAASASCNAAYPDLKTVLSRVEVRLDKRPLTLLVNGYSRGNDHDVEVTSKTLISALYSGLYVRDQIEHVPNLLHEIDDGRYVELRELVNRSEDFLSSGFTELMHYAMVCTEEPDMRMSDVDSAGVSPAVLRVAKDNMRDTLNACSGLNLPALDAKRMDEPVSSDVPTLLLSGQFDPITPPYYADEVLRTLPNGHAYTFGGSTHGQLGYGICASSLAAAFLIDPSATLDDACAQALRPHFYIQPSP